MTTTINASTSSGLVVTPDNSGNIVLQYNGRGAPAFRMYRAAQQTLANNTVTLITFDTVDFDTSSCCTTGASARVTPNVAGYYQVNAQVQTPWGSGSGPRLYGWIYKNGNQNSFYEANPTSASYVSVIFTDIIYCNGTTDYLDLRILQSTGSSLGISYGSPYVYMSGCLLRGA